MPKIAIIGAGIAGLTSARILSEKYEVTIYEKDDQAGGLARCIREDDGSLFHTSGGQVMENLSDEVRSLLAKVMNINDIIAINKNNAILFENGEVATPEFRGMFKKKMQEIEGVPNPIEKHIYMFRPDIQKNIISDIFRIKNRQKNRREPKFLATFLKAKFGDTLYDMYFGPYNEKVWRSDLKKIPMKWLSTNMDAPTPEEMLFSNFNHKEANDDNETFLYNINNGPQGIIDALKEGLDIRYNTTIQSITPQDGQWLVNGELYNKVIYCANLRNLPDMIACDWIESFRNEIDMLKYHGTTSVFCSLSRNPYTIVYLPGKEYKAHRIICTGNFSDTNTSDKYPTSGTIEFTDYLSEYEIKKELALMPLNPDYIDHKYAECTHPIQDIDTRKMVAALKKTLREKGMYLTGRLADWEFYNIVETMDAAIKTCKNI